MDARLRELQRAAEAGDPDAQERLDQERLRAGLRHQFLPEEIAFYGRTCCSVSRLRWGWCVMPRARVPRSRAHRPPERFDLVDEWRSGPHGQFAPGRVLAVIPESWLRSQAARLGDAFVEEWIRISAERRTIDERIIREEREAHDAAWRKIIDALIDGPLVMPARSLAQSVRRQLSADPDFRATDVGSRVVIGRADDAARYDHLLSDTRARSARARRAAETRRERITSVHSREPRPPSSSSRSSPPRPPRDVTTGRPWDEALERLRHELETGDGLVMRSTPQIARLLRLPSTAAAGELLAALRDGELPEAPDLYCIRSGDEWIVVPNGPRR